MYNELNLSEIKARGWVLKFLQTQAKGLTGHIGEVAKPFSLPTWGSDDKERSKNVNPFLGGINSIDDSWVPYEQNGYWIDGMVKAGWLIDDQDLITKAESKILPEIENADNDGYIGPSFLKNGLTWAHAVYFRSLIAEYTATGNQKILDALAKHFKRRPLSKSYEKNDLRIISVRNSAEIETVLWLYGQTKDEYFLTEAEKSYEEFNRRFSDDSVADECSKMYDITLDGMLANKKVQSNHGVTYCEICKLAAILHLYTGKNIYKKAAVKAFDKLVRDQMLIDGVPSSTEYLNGKNNSQCAHETCVVSDFTWAVGYLFMITGDSKYGDWVENAIFNGGLGSVDDNFISNQYFSCPNQAIANDVSNHAKFYRGLDWMSYAPKEFLACCAGNVHRFMPNYVYHSVMRKANEFRVFTYCPCEIKTKINDVLVTINEQTYYPFENQVLFTINTDKPSKFSLSLRKPAWAKEVQVLFNGERINEQFAFGFMNIEREFKNGDNIQITFRDEIEYIENANGISIKKGALLYALPITEKVVIEGLRELSNPDFPWYSLYPDSKWNYGVSLKDIKRAVFVEEKHSEEPWRKGESGLSIVLVGQEVKKLKINEVNKFKLRLKPRGKLFEKKQFASFTPIITRVKESDKLGEKENIKLVPYATTRLRIAIFPKINDKK